MNILLVEDDHLQSQFITEALGSEIPSGRIQVIDTEREFRARLEDISNNPPDVIILDVMLRWTDPSRDREAAPTDVREGKFHRAGFRCQKLLERGERTKKIPTILISAVDLKEFAPESRELPENVHIMPKKVSAKPLADLIRRLTGTASYPAGV